MARDLRLRHKLDAHEDQFGVAHRRCLGCGMSVALVQACDEDGFSMEPMLALCSRCSG